MTLSLKGKRAVVCGGSQGIGKAIAISLANQGASITLVARDKSKIKKVLNELEPSNYKDHNYIDADFNNYENLKEKFSNYLEKGNKADILINNTGGPPPGKITEAKIQEFQKKLNL